MGDGAPTYPNEHARFQAELRDRLDTVPRTSRGLYWLLHLLVFSVDDLGCFANMIFEVFSPKDVNLWCMEPEDDALPVKGEDTFNYGADSCARIVYAAFLASTSFLSLWKYFVKEADPEIIFRTMPMIQTKPTTLSYEKKNRLHDQWKRACECDLLTIEGALSADTVRMMQTHFVKCGLDVNYLYCSVATEVLSDDMKTATRVLAYIRDRGDAMSQRWMQRMLEHTWTDHDMKEACDEFRSSMNSCTMFEPPPGLGFTDTTFPFICQILARGSYRQEAREVLEVFLRKHYRSTGEIIIDKEYIHRDIETTERLIETLEYGRLTKSAAVNVLL